MEAMSYAIFCQKDCYFISKHNKKKFTGYLE